MKDELKVFLYVALTDSFQATKPNTGLFSKLIIYDREYDVTIQQRVKSLKYLTDRNNFTAQ